MWGRLLAWRHQSLAFGRTIGRHSKARPSRASRVSAQSQAGNAVCSCGRNGVQTTGGYKLQEQTEFHLSKVRCSQGCHIQVVLQACFDPMVNSTLLLCCNNTNLQTDCANKNYPGRLSPAARGAHDTT